MRQIDGGQGVWSENASGRRSEGRGSLGWDQGVQQSREWSGMSGSESGVVPKGTDDVFGVIRDQGFRSGGMQGKFKTEWELLKGGCTTQ